MRGWRGWRGWRGKSFLVLWVPSILLVTSLLMAGHIVSMPPPSDLDRLRRSLATLRSGGRAMAVHVIYENCSCTDSLMDHLMERSALPWVREVILFVGRGHEDLLGLEAAGFELHMTSQDKLVQDFSIESAPVLIAVDSDGSLLYVGGYYRFPAAVRPLDQKILSHVLVESRSMPSLPLPVYGCAVDKKLQEALDPLGLLYE